MIVSTTEWQKINSINIRRMAMTHNTWSTQIMQFAYTHLLPFTAMVNWLDGSEVITRGLESWPQTDPKSNQTLVVWSVNTLCFRFNSYMDGNYCFFLHDNSVTLNICCKEVHQKKVQQKPSRPWPWPWVVERQWEFSRIWFACIYQVSLLTWDMERFRSSEYRTELAILNIFFISLMKIMKNNRRSTIQWHNNRPR